ncbi:MAG TPA: UDP-N-acetylmuramoyl-L-alanine--D-glutamate ligase [Bacillota bacterium]|nr:UDP-N-acetylmuramoyl-L-alanine--D-glutamate ligase [Bacillota bacterium]
MKNLSSIPDNILVLGLAKSGTAAAKILLKHGKNVRVNDLKFNDDRVIETLTALGAEVIIGSHPISVLDDVEIIVKNPGIPYDNPLIKQAVKRNIPIITEIEIAYLLAKSPIIAVTGSNGKTTTTTLIGELLKAASENVKVAGNIGTVAIEVAQHTMETERLVLELSSFQLLGIKKFRPHISVLLNIYEAHLDYHKTFANYKRAKANIFVNQHQSDYLIYNADDITTATVVKQAKATLIPFSVLGKVKTGAWADEQAIYYKKEKIINRSQIALVGSHNLENILASICVAKRYNVATEHIQHVLKTFSGVEHRLQYVMTKHERKFYNDSKATNILATQKALAAFTDPVILLAGGLDRGNEFTDLIPYLSNVKGMITFGETAHKLQEVATQAKVPFIKQTKDLQSAVKIAYNHSAPKDIILLSPACASWDQYRTFEERGDMFIEAVHNLS